MATEVATRAGSLRGIEKAAVLLVAIGEERAGQIFSHLGQTEVEALSLEIAKSRKVPTTVSREVLGEAVEGAVGTGLLVDLRSTMYAAFWRPPAERAQRVATVRVLHEANGKRQVVSHFNKATKGRIVRALLEDGGNPRTPGALADLLLALGWKVELGSPNRRGTQLDVVVSEI
jgi:hypothetical protein